MFFPSSFFSLITDPVVCLKYVAIDYCDHLWSSGPFSYASFPFPFLILSWINIYYSYSLPGRLHTEHALLPGRYLAFKTLSYIFCEPRVLCDRMRSAGESELHSVCSFRRICIHSAFPAGSALALIPRLYLPPGDIFFIQYTSFIKSLINCSN